MPRRLAVAVARRLAGGAPRQLPAYDFSADDLVWALGSFCTLNRQPFDGELLVKQFPPPCGADTLIHAARALGFRIKRSECPAHAVAALSAPCLVVLREPPATPPEDGPAPAEAPRHRLALIASPVIQLLALGTPLFTQTIIDKVVVHRTESTLVVIAIGLAVFMVSFPRNFVFQA